MLNETQGGINGRKINPISLDDGYSPPKTVELARQLVERDQMPCLFYPLGTPTNTAIHKYMNQKKVPRIFVASGASKWGNPKQFPWTMGWQPGYRTEALIYAKHIRANHKNPKIAVLRQNDDMGNDYMAGENPRAAPWAPIRDPEGGPFGRLPLQRATARCIGPVNGEPGERRAEFA